VPRRREPGRPSRDQKQRGRGLAGCRLRKRSSAETRTVTRWLYERCGRQVYIIYIMRHGYSRSGGTCRGGTGLVPLPPSRRSGSIRIAMDEIPRFSTRRGTAPRLPPAGTAPTMARSQGAKVRLVPKTKAAHPKQRRARHRADAAQPREIPILLSNLQYFMRVSSEGAAREVQRGVPAESLHNIGAWPLLCGSHFT
jgi:hypothetical protein